MFMSPLYQEGILYLIIYAGVSLVPVFLIVFGTVMFSKKKGWISALLFLVGFIIGVGSTIGPFARRLWYTRAGLNLPWGFIFIGIVFVVVSMLIPPQNPPWNNKRMNTALLVIAIILG